jgi:hypothetical protein
MSSAELSRRVERVVGYPPLVLLQRIDYTGRLALKPG